MSNSASTPSTPSTSLNLSKLLSTSSPFYILLLLLGLLQAYSTELFDDEAYYWVYAQFLDWGYFDHPPMIALLIKMGVSIFPGELGVRFFIVLMGVATIWMIENCFTYSS
jgi:4-amino-4-deoxy-L-arabinose transferase-like glycosyltransferase